jgi:hypothetical protein
MRKLLLLFVPMLALLPLAALADDSLVKFDVGIGVIPVSSGVGTTANAGVFAALICEAVAPFT